MLTGIGTGPINGTLKAAKSAGLSGLLLTADGTTNKVLLTEAVTDTPIGVTIESSQRDKDDALVAGGRVSFMPSGGVLYMRAEAATYTVGQTVYVGATDGFCSDSSAASAVAVGVYVGPGETISAQNVTDEENLILVNTNNVGW
tara:strand:- start:4738 stop:5169 length:432 start_codon:yes stop_codon:yes gene_type:complete